MDRPSTNSALETTHSFFSPLLTFCPRYQKPHRKWSARLFTDIPPSSTTEPLQRCDVSCRDDVTERFTPHARGDNRALSPEFIDGPH